MTITLAVKHNPIKRNRSSRSEWSGSSSRMAFSSRNAVLAASNEMPCRRSFRRAFRGSHENRNSVTHYIVTTGRPTFNWHLIVPLQTESTFLSSQEASRIRYTDGSMAAPRLTPTQWLICGVASLGFAFDIYAVLMLPLIVGPALGEPGHLKPGTRPE